MLPLTRK